MVRGSGGCQAAAVTEPTAPAPVLLLLHGLGATGSVWAPVAPLLDEAWDGRWLAPDLPGHGGAAPLARYSFGGLAAAVADRVVDEVGPGVPLVVVGHSLGGVVALALASGWYGVDVTRVVGLGIKVAWTADELARAASMAARATAWFGSRDDAVDRHLKVAGLTGLVEPDARAATDGVLEADGPDETDRRRWRLALDQRAFAVGAPDLPGLLAASRAEVLLARGEHDHMVTDAQLAELVADDRRAVLLGLGHNAHVEDPHAVLRLVG